MDAASQDDWGPMRLWTSKGFQAAALTYLILKS